MNVHKLKILLAYLLVSFLLVSCGKGEVAQTTVAEQGKIVESSMANLSEDKVRDIVRRSYQYVALYNIINKGALDTESLASTSGFNKVNVATALYDHNVRVFWQHSNL
jgi:hypothetical protein